MLPPRWKLDKRWRFWRRVKTATNTTSLTIFCNTLIEPNNLANFFSKFFQDKQKQVIRDDPGLLIFSSEKSNVTYQVKLHEGEAEKSIVTVETTNGFSLNGIGSLKGFKTFMDELQEIRNLFSRIAEETPNVTTNIKFTMKPEGFIKKLLDYGKAPEIKIHYQERGFNYNCTQNHIKIVNAGLINLEEQIKGAFFIWIDVFL